MAIAVYLICRDENFSSIEGYPSIEEFPSFSGIFLRFQLFSFSCLNLEALKSILTRDGDMEGWGVRDGGIMDGGYI